MPWSLCGHSSSSEFYSDLTLQVAFLPWKSVFTSCGLSSLPTFSFSEGEEKGGGGKRARFGHGRDGSLSVSCRRSKNVLDAAINQSLRAKSVVSFLSIDLVCNFPLSAGAAGQPVGKWGQVQENGGPGNSSPFVGKRFFKDHSYLLAPFFDLKS